MAVGHSEDLDAADAVASVLEQCGEALAGATPQAAFLFSTFDTDPQMLVSGIRGAYPDVQLIGSTSMAEMSSVLGYREDSVTLAMFVSDTVDITSGLGEGLSTDWEGAIRRAVAEARAGTDKEPRLCIAMPSIGGGDPSDLVRVLRDELGEDVPILGGGAAPRVAGDPAGDAKQFFNDRIVDDAIPLVLFSGPLTYSFGVDTGWRPVGKKGRVTRVSGTLVEEIDGAPAIEFYQRYLGAEAKPTQANPLAVFEGDGEEFYLRVVVADPEADGAVRTTGGLPEGATVQLTVAVTQEIFDGARSALQKAVKAFPEGSPPEAALMFSCAIRKYLLGTRTGHEFEIALEELGTVPICGFYSYGEIAPVEPGSPTRFHNETMVALLLGSD
jgi:hypothetical protein